MCVFAASTVDCTTALQFVVYDGATSSMINISVVGLILTITVATGNVAIR